MSLKNPYDPIWNRTLDLPVCSAVPQPTVQSPNNVRKSLQYERERWVVVVSTGHLEICRKGAGKEAGPFVRKEKRRYLYCLNVKRLRYIERIFLNYK